MLRLIRVPLPLADDDDKRSPSLLLQWQSSSLGACLVFSLTEQVVNASVTIDETFEPDACTSVEPVLIGGATPVVGLGCRTMCDIGSHGLQKESKLLIVVA